MTKYTITPATTARTSGKSAPPRRGRRQAQGPRRLSPGCCLMAMARTPCATGTGRMCCAANAASAPPGSGSSGRDRGDCLACMRSSPCSAPRCAPAIAAMMCRPAPSAACATGARRLRQRRAQRRPAAVGVDAGNCRGRGAGRTVSRLLVEAGEALYGPRWRSELAARWASTNAPCGVGRQANYRRAPASTSTRSSSRKARGRARCAARPVASGSGWVASSRCA